jgi:hypothetical protein
MDESSTARLRQILERVDAVVPAAGGASEVADAQLEECDDQALQDIARDSTCSTTVRISALRILTSRHQRDRSQAELLADLFRDTDETIVIEAVRAYPPFDGRMAERLHGLLADPRTAVWSEAASLLARRNDPGVRRILLRWLNGEDFARFRVAIQSLPAIVSDDDRLRVLSRLWDRGRPDDGSRLLIAEDLLRLGDEHGLEFLVDVALRAEPESLRAAEAVYTHDTPAGLALLTELLDHPDPEARRRVAEWILRRATVSSIEDTQVVAAARAWVDRAMANAQPE